MTEFTKGPWKTYRDGKDIRIEPVNDVSPFWIAKMVSAQPIGMATGEREANARLIAAAPDLLEACKDAVRVLEAMGHKDTVCAIDLRTTIAKAEATNV